mgnify:CR=1 FL=1
MDEERKNNVFLDYLPMILVAVLVLIVFYFLIPIEINQAAYQPSGSAPFLISRAFGIAE